MSTTIEAGRTATFTKPDETHPIRASWGARVFQSRTQVIVRFSNGFRTPDRGSQAIPLVTVTPPRGFVPATVPPGHRWDGSHLTIAPTWWKAKTPKVVRFLPKNDKGYPITPDVLMTTMPTGIRHVMRLSSNIGTEVLNQAPAVGWNPAGDFEGDTQGGMGIEPSPGIGLEWSTHAYLSDAWRQRSAIDDLDPDTGEPVYSSGPVDLQQVHHEPSRYGKEWLDKAGAECVVGSFDAESDIAWSRWCLIDGEHKVREIRHDIALAFLWNDPCALLNLRMSAKRVMNAIKTDDMLATIAAARPEARPSMGRIHGWAAYTVAACWLAHGHEAPRKMPGAMQWMYAMRDLYIVSQDGSGLFQHEGPPVPNNPGYDYWSPNPRGTVPPDKRIGQSHEHGILICGLHVLARALTTADANAISAIERAAYVWFRASAPPPRKWLATTGETYGEPESLYLDWAASFANYWLPSHGWADRLLRMRGFAQGDIVTRANAWLDRWENNDDGLIHLRIDSIYMFGILAGKWQ